MSSDCKFILVGTPLDEELPLSKEAVLAVEKCSVIIAEQKRVFEKQAKRAQCSITDKKVLYMDNGRDDQEIKATLRQRSHSIALLSDTGMPVLFDPGSEILKLARKFQYTIQTVPSATSWATAACVSGFAPPFFIEGFLPQEKEARKKRLKELHSLPGHKVLLDTPYRYLSLLEDLKETFGPAQGLFLAWEIASPLEFYFWGSIDELLKLSEKRSMKKGEFILVVE